MIFWNDYYQIAMMKMKQALNMFKSVSLWGPKLQCQDHQNFANKLLETLNWAAIQPWGKGC